MAKDLEANFDDPALKHAVKRVWGSQTAPAELRRRVAEALAVELSTASNAPAEAVKPKFDWRRSPLVGLAAAAMILVGFGVIFINMRDTSEPLAYELPADLAANMVAAHDYAVVDGNLPDLPGVPKSDFNQIRSAIKARLNHPVLVGSLGGDWQLEGAGIAQVGTTDVSQLVFRKGDEKVSVFSISLASRPYSPGDGTDYAQEVQGHPIAGVVKGGAIHCIVGSKNSTLRPKDVAKLRDRVKDLIALDDLRGEVQLAQSRFNGSACRTSSSF